MKKSLYDLIAFALAIILIIGLVAVAYFEILDQEKTDGNSRDMAGAINKTSVKGADGWYIATIGDSLTYNLGTGYNGLLRSYLGNRWAVTNNGVDSRRTYDLINNYSQEIYPLHPAYAIVLAGTNDLLIDGQTDPVAIKSNLQTYYNMLIANGTTPVLVTIPASSGYNDAINSTLASINGWIRACGTASGLNVVDLWALTVDQSTGNRLDPAFDGGDGVHLNSNAYFALIDAIEAWWFSGGAMASDKPVNRNGNICANPNFKNNVRGWYTTGPGYPVTSLSPLPSGSGNSINVTRTAGGWFDLYYPFDMVAGTEYAIRAIAKSEQNGSFTIAVVQNGGSYRTYSDHSLILEKGVEQELNLTFIAPLSDQVFLVFSTDDPGMNTFHISDVSIKETW